LQYKETLKGRGVVHQEMNPLSLVLNTSAGGTWISPLGMDTKRTSHLGRADTPKGVAGEHSPGVGDTLVRYV